MSNDLRPRRSVLYMPAANERALEKAKTLPADAIIFDLEDAVAPDAKETARPNAVAAAGSSEYGNRELTIRCNGLDTPWGADDLRAAATSGASAVVVPKVGTVAYLDEISSSNTTPSPPGVIGSSLKVRAGRSRVRSRTLTRTSSAEWVTSTTGRSVPPCNSAFVATSDTSNSA